MERRSLSVLIPLLAAAGGVAQSVTPDVLSASGGHGNSGEQQISWTIGEPVITTATSGANTLTQGFQQPWVDISTDEEETIASGPGIAVYPNPTRHLLNVVYDGSPGNDRFELHDASGRIVQGDRVTSTHTVLNMEHYASGMYMLRLLGSDDSVLRTFKINVNQ